MPLDPRIALGVQPMQLQMPDPNAGMNSLARMMQIRGMQDEQQVNALKVDEYKRTNERRNKLDSLLGGFSGKPEELGSTLLRGGFLDESQKVEKDRREGMKADADADAKRVETAQKRVESWGQTMGWVRQNPTPESAVSAVRYLVTIGVIPQDMAQAALANVGNDPQSITQWATQGFQAALSAKDQLPKYDTRNLGGSTQTTAIDPVTGQVRVVNSVANTATPGDLLADKRAGQRLQQAEDHFQAGQNAPRGQFIETTNGYVLADPKTGAVRPVTGADGQPLKGKAADRQMTDAQAKANLFGSRMKESDRILSSLEGKYSPMAVNAKVGAEKVPLVGGAAGYAANKMLSDAGQQAEQAQRDFINAVLRRESGAVITDPEFDNAKKQYLPQPGDSPAVLTQKRRNRNLAIQGMEAEVPGGFRSGPSLSSPTGSSGGATGDFGGGWKIERVN
jgi:hypothetical protein